MMTTSLNYIKMYWNDINLEYLKSIASYDGAKIKKKMIQTTTTSSSFKRFVCLEKTLKKFSNDEELSDFYFYFFVAFFPLFV